jgi:predicted AAA+ superfamily ATPase
MKNQFSESLAGRKRIFETYPLSFKEFLNFKNADLPNFEKYSRALFNKAWDSKYAEYIRFGGFPEVVLESCCKSN